MNEDAVVTPPDGFVLFPDSLQFGDAVAPGYYKVDGQGFRTGFFVRQKHINSIGICHGGALMTFADMSFGGNIMHHVKSQVGLPTVSLTIDFLAPGHLGDWLEFHLDHLFTTRLLGTMAAVIEGPHGLVARTSATFRLPKIPHEPVVAK